MPVAPGTFDRFGDQKCRPVHRLFWCCTRTRASRGITQNLHAKGELWHQLAVDGLMKLCVYLKNGDGEVANRIPHGNKNCCSWPSAMKNQLGKKGKK